MAPARESGRYTRTIGLRGRRMGRGRPTERFSHDPTFLAAGVSAAALALALPAARRMRPRRAGDGIRHLGRRPGLARFRRQPGDDFFAYVNGKWVRDNPLPPEFTRYGAFDA
jgi:hypothetical protein